MWVAESGSRPGKSGMNPPPHVINCKEVILLLNTLIDMVAIIVYAPESA